MKYYSIHFNRPDFVEIQYNLSKKVGYDLVIVNNGRNKSIKDISEKLNVEYIETDNIGKNSMSHGNSINQILPKINMNKEWGLLDHDMFIIENIDFTDFEITSIKCDNIKDKPYLWPGMIICKGGVDISNIDFKPGVSIKGDTGSGTNLIVDNFKIKWCEKKYIGVKNKLMIQNSTIITKHMIDQKVIGYHYLNGSNWTEGDGIENKNKLLMKLIKNL